MRITVINLARATDRRQFMERQAQTLGLAFDFLEATDGKTLADTDRALIDHDKRKAISPYPLTDNELGCWLSHRRAMQALLDSGETMCAILEDDAALSPDFPRVLAAIKSLPESSFDVIDLHRNFKRNEIFAFCRKLTDGYDLGRIGTTHMNATGYVVTRKGAEKTLASTPKAAHAIDKDMHRYWANGLDFYGLSQPVAKQQDNGHSYIDETRGQDRPADRPRYPDADRPIWRFRRRWTKLCDTLAKRAIFPYYVWKGRKNLSA
ncbi:MAG: glycosyltransferase family 25 protein [Bdellovibrionales bacterium]